MALSITVHGQGTFTASMEEGPVTFTAAIASVGPQGAKGDTGDTGVVAATSPITYDSLTKTVALDRAAEDAAVESAIANGTITPNSIRVNAIAFGTTGIPTIQNEAFSSSLLTPYALISSLGAAAYESLTYWVRSPSVAATDTQILSWDAGTSRPLWIDNQARTLFLNGTNKTGTTIAKGKAVYVSGATGNHPEITLAIATSELSSSRTIGITAEEIANNGTGKVIVAGALENVDTSAFTAGDVLYLSSSTAGGFQTSLPTQPNHGVLMGYVVRANANVGVIEVRVDNYQELGEQSDVLLTSKANGDFLVYESATSLWKNKSAATLDLLTATTASSTYAPLASPALTGTPTAPTAAAATNTTQIATTAFVQQEVPNASTTARGKVELATEAEAVAGTSTTLAVTPSGLDQNRLSPSYKVAYSGAGFTQVVSGTGSTAVTDLAVTVATGANASSYGIRRIGGTTSLFQRAQNIGVVTFSTEIELAFSCVINRNMASDQTARVTFGKLAADNNGDLTRKGFGIRITGTNAVELQVHDGTNLSNVSSSFSYTAGQAFDVRIVSNNGTVTLFINDSQVATSSAGPTGANAANTHNNLQIEIENVTAQTNSAITATSIVMRFAR